MAEKIDWSPYQKKIFLNVAKEPSGHLIVEALAGSGKTTTLIQSIRYVPKGKKVIALAFNKIIQKELEERVSASVLAKTFHSFGLMAIKQKFPQIIIDNNKVFNIAKQYDECILEKDRLDYGLIFSICDAVSFCKYFLNDSPSSIDEIIDEFNIDYGELERKTFISLVIRTLGKDKADTSRIDFDDMCYFPFVYDIALPQADFVFIDERQDLNKAQMVMAKKACKTDGRIIAFGDTFQDLYNWRGSDNSIIEDLKKEPDTKVLNLPISYRCPKKVIELVKTWVPDITCPEDAKEGEINNIIVNDLYKKVKPGDFIISRTNAPLIAICMSLIKEKIKANIRGKDIPQQLKSLIKKSKKKKVDAFLKWLDKWKSDEIEKIKGKKVKPDTIIDKYECLVNLCEDAKNLDEVSKNIDMLFNDTDEKNIVILGTTHAMKGLERDNVFILKWTYWKWFNNILPGMTQDFELNIAYVACSRAKSKLYLVNKPL